MIRLAVKDAVATLTIDAPERLNAISLAMWQALPALVAQADTDPLVRLIALAGAGEKAFCAGADISRFGAERGDATAAAAYDAAVERAESALAGAAKPTVALIHGLCLGGGLGLVMCCDLRLASDAASFRLPAARLGIGYGLAGVARLYRRLGPGAAAEVLLTAKLYGAAQARDLGIVTQLCPAADFGRACQDYCAAIAANAPLSLRAAKLALAHLEQPGGNEAAARAAVAACYGSADYAEGRLAFAQKRAPRFQGR